MEKNVKFFFFDLNFRLKSMNTLSRIKLVHNCSQRGMRKDFTTHLSFYSTTIARANSLSNRILERNSLQSIEIAQLTANRSHACHHILQHSRSKHTQAVFHACLVCINLTQMCLLTTASTAVPANSRCRYIHRCKPCPNFSADKVDSFH